MWRFLVLALLHAAKGLIFILLEHSVERSCTAALGYAATIDD